jgi:hypothetical protein
MAAKLDAQPGPSRRRREPARADPKLDQFMVRRALTDRFSSFVACDTSAVQDVALK